LKSACAVLAWSILVVLVAAGMKGSVSPAQANIRTASSTTQVTLASTLSVAAAPKTVARPVSRYAVRPGDTLSGIAARFAVRGGWPALYAANRPRIGSDPNVIRPGTVLVLPGRMAPARYTVVAGDTLAGIAARLAVRGGWPALYAANRPRIGSDPNLIRPGTVLTVRRAAPSPPAGGPGRRLPPAPSSSAPAGSGHRPLPTGTGAPAATGVPQWVKILLLAAGLVTGAAFVAGSVLAVRRRRQQAAAGAARPGPADSGPGPGSGRVAAARARIVLADHDRVVVAHSPRDGAVYVLRPPGEDPGAILRAARLVLPEDLYRELAEQLGMPASWPIVLADHDRVVVAHSPRDGAVYVLRPPGEDPGAILRAARLVLPEEPYGELADQLGVPAGWPMGTGVPTEAGRGRAPWPASWLAWSILLIMAAAGMTGPVRPAQANTRIASSTTEVTLASTLSAAAAPGPAARPAARYVVQPGDTLAGIAARLGVRGGWPALYAANRHVIGPDPDVIRPGAVLVLPGRRAPARYRVVSGDTLAGIAAALAVRGGWPALYAANRHVVGPDPDVIRPGEVLTVPRPAAPSPAPPRPAGRPVPPPSALPGAGQPPLPGRTGARAATGVPSWVKTLLLAAGLVTGAASLAGPAVLVIRRRRQAAAGAARPGRGGVGGRGCSRSAAAAVRSAAAAARVHPAGVAVPGAVLAAGVVLFTFVESATVRVVPPPGGSGPGSVSAARPGTGQPHHRLQPRQSGAPGQPALPGSTGQDARSPACGLGQVAPPLPVLAAVPPAGPGRGPRASRNPSSPLPGAGLACDVTRVPSPAATDAAGSRGADR
jgi:LysM repeat protein